MDLVENKDKSTVTATFELPGLKKEDVNIDVRNNQLIVSGESSISTNKDEGDYVVRERSYGKFSRTLQLPQGVKVCLLSLSAHTSSDMPHRKTKLRLIWRTAF
jgi:HSP20 family protein